MKSPSEAGREAIRKALNDKSKVLTKVHKAVSDKQQATEARLRSEQDEREREKLSKAPRTKSHVELAVDEGNKRHDVLVDKLVEHMIDLISPEKPGGVPSSAKKMRPPPTPELPELTWLDIRGKQQHGMLLLAKQYGYLSAHGCLRSPLDPDEIP